MNRRLRNVVLPCVLLLAGCAHERHLTDARHPEIVISATGAVQWRGAIVSPEDLPDLLDDSDYPKTSTVNIRVADELTDYRVPRHVMGILARAGYRRSVLQKEQRAYSGPSSKMKKPAPPQQPTLPSVRVRR